MIHHKFLFSLLLLLFSVVKIANAQTLVPANNAENVSNDMQFQLKFSSAPQLQNSGNIKLYKSGGTLVETINLSSMPSGTPMSDTWPWTETLNGSTIRVIPVTADGNSLYIRFSMDAMEYNTSYYVTVDQSVLSNASSLGFSGISANEWSFTTRSEPAADNDYVVSADGTGDFATLQGALNFLSSGKDSKIYVKNGTYIGLAYIKNKDGYTIEGQSRDGVIFKGYNNSNLNASTHWRSVINISGDDINILNITLINTTPNGGSQAEALKLSGDRCVIANCVFDSYQDTLLIEGKVYFIDCLVIGDVDFIWGRGTVYFQSCELRANDDGGYNVMARNDNTIHGYCFADCQLTHESSSTTKQYLGRDANTGYPYAEIIYLECTMGSQIPSVGWQIRDEMNGTDILFAEYKSVDESGNLINTSSRHSLSKQLSSSDAALYRDLDWFFNGWTPVVPSYNSNKISVELTSPAEGDAFAAPAIIPLSATAEIEGGTVLKVDFYVDDERIVEKYIAPYNWETDELPAGTYTIKAVAYDSDYNTAETSITVKVNVPQAPYGGTAHAIPGIIQAEAFDEGGNGFAYFDDSSGSETDQIFRTDEDVDITDCEDEGGGYCLAYVTEGEWVEYTVNVAEAGTYNINLRVANNGDPKTISLAMDGADIATDITIPNTEGWGIWETVTVENIELKEGEQILRFTMGDVKYVNLNYIKFELQEVPIIVSFQAGWNLLGYPFKESAAVETALSDIWDKVELIKDFNEFYDKTNLPELNSLKELKYGRGYFIKVNEDCEINW